MKSLLLTFLFILLIRFYSSAQENDVWTAFRNNDTTLVGFKDKAGNIKIRPTFNNWTTAQKFKDIIIANNYYVTKKGKTVGKGNLYIYDNTPDCESEGFIRFRDSLTHKVGMFDRSGDIAIPAIYNDLMPVRNGLIAALNGGHWDVSQQSEHNQYPWIGSKGLLIDIHNKVLITNFHYDNEINFFSLLISAKPSKNPIRESFKSNNGKYYSFINFDKEFRAWLKDSLLNNLTKYNLLKFSYANITFWDNQKHWETEPKKQFFTRNFNLIRSKLTELNSSNSHYEIFLEDLNFLMYTGKEFERYYDNCGASKNWISPTKDVVISHYIGKDIFQDSFQFLRTNKGYRLIEVSIKTGELKE